MKKLSFIIALCVFIPLFVSAQKGTTKDGFKYVVKNNAVTITKWKGKKGADIIIPATIVGLPVKEIGKFAFSDKGIRSLVLPESITTIRGAAFSGCNITHLVLPKNLNLVEYFSNSSTLGYPTTIEVPQALEQLDDKNEMALPRDFIAWYRAHGSQAGTYTYEEIKKGKGDIDTERKWYLNGKLPAPEANAKLVLRRGNVLYNTQLWLKSVNNGPRNEWPKNVQYFLTMLPPGDYVFGFSVSGKLIGSGEWETSSYFVEATLEAGKTYEVTYHIHNIDRFQAPKYNDITFKIKEVE